MNYIKSLTQQKLSLLLSLYIGILLNLPIFYRRFDPFLNKSTLTDWLSAGAEVMAIVLLTFFLMRLLSLGGKLFYRILATVLVSELKWKKKSRPQIAAEEAPELAERREP